MPTPSRVRRRALAGAALTVLALAAAPRPGHTQAKPSRVAANARDTSAQSANEVSEVVVTALKREQRLIDTPVPVTAIAPETLERIAAVNFQDYLARVPGFQDISGRQGLTQLILRGITTGPQPNATVGTYVDDTPFGSSSVFASGGTLTPDFDPSDLQRVEVLRGPQGTLYGASTLGGLIKFVTTPPDPNGFHARIEADGESVAHGGEGYGLRGAVNLPIVPDKLAVRANAFYREDPGYIDDPFLGRHNLNDTRVYGGRASLLWNFSDKLSLRLTATLENLKGLGSPDEDVDLTTLKPLYASYQQRRFESEILDNRYRIYNGELTWDLGLADLIASTSYSTLRALGNADITTAIGALVSGVVGIPNLGVDEPSPIKTDRFTEEVRLASKPGRRLDWLAGFYFDHQRSEGTQTFEPFDTVSGAPVSLPFSLAKDTLQSRYTEYAGFADLTYHFTSRFDILGGVRYSGNNQHYTQGQGGLFFGDPFGFSTLPAATSSDSTATFLVTPEYKFNPDSLVYLRIASGYRPGGPNALPPSELAAGVPASFKPDSLVDYEVGYKATLFDHRLTVDVSAFYIDWTDVQLLTTVGVFVVEGNGGKATSKGAEGTITFTPLRGLTLSDNFAYTNTELTVDAPAAGGRSGDRLPYVPLWSENINIDYDWSLADDWDAYVGASYRFIDDRPGAFAVSAAPGFTRTPSLPSYQVVDLRAGLIHNGYTVNIFIKNANDARGFTSLGSLALDPALNPYTASLIQPRTFGVSVSTQF